MDGIELGTQFDFSFAPGTTEQQILGFEMAGEIWSQYLTDDVTITDSKTLTDDVSLSIHVEMLELPSGKLGAAYPALLSSVRYGKFLRLAEDDILSGADAVAFDNLQGIETRPRGSAKYDKIVGGEIVPDNSHVMLTRANARALGKEPKRRYGGLDGYIQMDSNTSWSYDFLRNNTPHPDQYDFLTVAMHEIGHVLGFVSSVDSHMDALSSSLDMFRYSQASTNQGIYDFSLGTEAYFSIDGGQTIIAEFSRGQGSSDNPDGYNYQASHWADNQDVGLMNPIINQGEIVNISATDLLAMDVIGWDINPDATIDLASLFQRAQANAAVAPVEDRSRKVAKMKADSDVYDWWWQNNGGGNSWWQEGTSNALESLPSEAESNDSPPLYVTFFQDVLPPVVQEYILSENYDLKNEDISGGEQLVFNFENSQDIIAEHTEVKDWLLSDVFFPGDLISDLLEGSSRFATIQNYQLSIQHLDWVRVWSKVVGSSRDR